MMDFMIHTATGEIASIPAEVFRRILTQAQFSLPKLPDITGVERKAIDAILKLQFKYPQLI
jgi:hypothetical protein